MGATSLGLKIRWWINAERSEEVISRARAIQAIKETFQANDIDPTDPSLVYTVNTKTDSIVEPSTPAAPLQNIKKAPTPPKYLMDKEDPKTYTPKGDHKSSTSVHSGILMSLPLPVNVSPYKSVRYWFNRLPERL